MALNKRKLLETARKHAQKGAKAKALKEYNLLLKADPRDAKLLLEVGDSYRRWGQADEALAQYGKVHMLGHELEAQSLGILAQRVELDFGVLAGGADSGVDRSAAALHGGGSSLGEWPARP